MESKDCSNSYTSPAEMVLPKNAKRRCSTGESTKDNPVHNPLSDSGEDLSLPQKQTSWQELNLSKLRKCSVCCSNHDIDICTLNPTLNSVGERVAEMFDNPRYADVLFKVGEGEETIHAHKFILSITSDVFARMLNVDAFTETKGGGLYEIRVPDIEASVFRKLLKFIYTDHIHLDPDSVTSVLYSARKYAIKALETKCSDFLEKHLTVDNAFVILSQARMFDQYKLEKSCLELIDHETQETLKADGFLEVGRTLLCDILRRDTLRIKETDLFAACMAWAEAECRRRELDVTGAHLREVLGDDALHLIRFPLMTIEEFSQKIVQHRNVLRDSEVVELFLHYHVNPKPNIPFVSRNRYRVLGKELVINRFQRIEGRWGYSGSPDRVKFSVDVPIFVTALGLYGSMHGPYLYSAVIEITDFSTGKQMAYNEATYQSDGMANVFRVPFKEPVEILANVTYEIAATIKGPDSHYGSKGLRRISRQTPNGVITFQFSFAHGINNGTSVDDGQIPEMVFCLKVV